MTIINTTDENFEKDVLKNEKAVLTDFWAPWCSPCLQLSPILESIAEEMKDQIVIAKHNIDDFPNMPSRYGVRGIPTLLLFKNGELVGTQVGVSTRENLINFIKKNI